jgi:hypothetical protein
MKKSSIVPSIAKWASFPSNTLEDGIFPVPEPAFVDGGAFRGGLLKSLQSAKFTHSDAR